MAKKVSKAELTRIRNRNVRRLRKAGATEDKIKGYLKGWSIPDNRNHEDSEK